MRETMPDLTPLWRIRHANDGEDTGMAGRVPACEELRATMAGALLLHWLLSVSLAEYSNIQQHQQPGRHLG